MVEPKQQALVDAQNELKAAQDKLDFLNNKILVSALCFVTLETQFFFFSFKIKNRKVLNLKKKHSL